MKLNNPNFLLWKIGKRCLSFMVIIGMGILLLSFHNILIAQSQKLIVRSGRPAASAIEILEARHGVIITYEDVPYSYEGDMTDTTSPKYREAHPNDTRRALIPRAASLEMTYQLSSGPIRSVEMNSVIQRLLDIHAERNNPGRFRLQQAGDYFHVIPSQVRDRSGRLMAVTSILDTPVSFPEQEHSGIEFLNIIINEISRAKGIEKIFIGEAPRNLLNKTSSHQKATNKKARDLLVDILKLPQSKLTWQLFYDPSLKWYALNIHQVQ